MVRYFTKDLINDVKKEVNERRNYEAEPSTTHATTAEEDSIGCCRKGYDLGKKKALRMKKISVEAFNE